MKDLLEEIEDVLESHLMNRVQKVAAKAAGSRFSVSVSSTTEPKRSSEEYAVLVTSRDPKLSPTLSQLRGVCQALTRKFPGYTCKPIGKPAAKIGFGRITMVK